MLEDEINQVIPVAWWDACVDTRSRITGNRVFAVDVTPDRSTAAIVVVGKSERGGVHVETVEHRPGAGSDWIPGRLAGLGRQVANTCRSGASGRSCGVARGNTARPTR